MISAVLIPLAVVLAVFAVASVPAALVVLLIPQGNEREEN